MTIPGSINSLLLSRKGSGYTISRSLRFNSADSPKLSRTYSSGSSTTTQTFSVWLKRSKLGAQGHLWSGYNGTAAYGAYFQFEANNTVTVILGGASLYQLTTTQVFRDVSAWYHFVLTIDTNNGTSTDRVRLYVNGARVTTFSTATYPTSGYACQFAMGNANNSIGTSWGSSAYSFFDGCLADIHFIDAQALTPSSFGETDATTGVWVPKAYTGTYSGNSFHLEFADYSSNTATTLGKDTSGLGNNWTPNNLSVTAGAGNDSLVDFPANDVASSGGDAGGTTRGNYATLNPLASSGTLSNGNLDQTSTAAGHARGTIGLSTGKWYWEVTPTVDATSNAMIGIVTAAASLTQYIGNNANGWGYFSSNGRKYNNNTNATYGATYAANDVIGVALDLDNGTLTFYKNGSTQGTAYTGLTSGPYFPAVSNATGSGATVTYACNFGARPFQTAAPAGYKALCTANLPTPTIVKPSSFMDVVLYTGDNGTQTISGLGFSPDLVWVKNRSAAYSHVISDTVRGANLKLASNSTGAEGGVDNGTISAFNSNGFTVAMGTGYYAGYETNIGGYPFIGWCWDAGSSAAASNNSGTITSTVKANASAGFSIVSYTGNGAAANIGHGLGVEPHLIIHKFRGATSNWSVYTKATGAGGRLLLNSTAAFSSDGAFPTAPTSSIFYVNSGTNDNGVSMIAYCFAPIVGFSSAFSYTGNGSTDGPMVWLGFRPRLILYKNATTAATNWILVDTARNTYNVLTTGLRPNLNTSEAAPDTMDILSNGFKIRDSGTQGNANGATIIGFAWAESPFNYARAR